MEKPEKRMTGWEIVKIFLFILPVAGAILGAAYVMASKQGDQYRTAVMRNYGGKAEACRALRGPMAPDVATACKQAESMIAYGAPEMATSLEICSASEPGKNPFCDDIRADAEKARKTMAAK